MGVEADNEANVPVGEVCKHILEGLGQQRVILNLLHRPGQYRVQIGVFRNLGNGGVLGRSKSQEAWSDPVEVSVLNALKSLVFLEVKVFKVAALFLLGLPDTIYDILDRDAVVSLAVASISEGHQRRLDLGNGRKSEMRRPSLDEHHVASKHAGGVGATYFLLVEPPSKTSLFVFFLLTSGVSSAPEDNGPITVLLSTEDLVELNRKAVQVANVQRPKVVVEGIVEQGVVNGEVARRASVRVLGG